MPGTLVRIRGNLVIANTGSDRTNGATDVGLKIMYVEVNDAGTISGDHAGIDSEEEDIANRQLWAMMTRVMKATADDNSPRVEVEVDVRAKVKLVASGKWILALLADATTANRAQMTGQLRCLIMHA